MSDKFAWQNSLYHIELLKRFLQPYDVSQPENFGGYITGKLNEDVYEVIHRFLEQGYISECSLEDSVDYYVTVETIRNVLRQFRLKVSGRKREIVKRLIDYDAKIAQDLISDLRILCCTQAGIDFIDKYEKEKARAEQHAKAESFDYLMQGDGVAAYQIYWDFSFQYTYYGIYSDTNAFDAILSLKTSFIDGFSSEEFNRLKVAVCAMLLWHGTKLNDWVQVEKSETERLANLLKRSGWITSRISGYDELDEIQISFDKYDVESCDLCKKLHGRKYIAREFPTFPLNGCTSHSGCQFGFSSYFEDDRGERLAEAIISRYMTRIKKIVHLKNLLRIEKISQEEYEEQVQQWIDEL